MKRFLAVLLMGLTGAAAGCAMCSSCDDYNYSAQGGRWQRADPVFGRVGSAFTDAGFRVSDEEAAEHAGTSPLGEPALAQP